ncbi:MAG: hypothetical protein ABEI99_01035, partial [Halobaculum sp.]
FHIFNNPAYLWLTGDLRSAAESGYTEPEAGDPDEAGNATDESADLASSSVELLDEIQVLVWHDDGDNVLGETELVASPHDVDRSTAIDLPRSDAIVTGGTLREFLSEVSDGGVPLDADSRSPTRDCYPYSTTRHVCVAWWLPVDHANEIQTDSVAFDLGFYTEQCRHNDGTGTAP